MKKILLFSLMACFVSFFFLIGCSSVGGPADAYKGETAEAIFNEGKKSLQDKNYSDATRHFEALTVQYPFGKETEKAQLLLIYAYYMKDENLLAASTAQRFIQVHPTSAHVDYAYYMQGLSNYYQSIGALERIFSVDLATRDLQQLQKSFASFQTLTQLYPDSAYAGAAHQYQIYLRNVIASHELQIAQFYYDRRAFLAAANRASDIVAHFQGANAVKSALHLMVKAYHQLGMQHLEQQTQRVIDYNHLNENYPLKPLVMG